MYTVNTHTHLYTHMHMCVHTPKINGIKNRIAGRIYIVYGY